MIARRLTQYGLFFAVAVATVTAHLLGMQPASVLKKPSNQEKSADTSAAAKQATDKSMKAEKKDPSSKEQTPFAPGIVTVIPPSPKPEETVDGPQTLRELLEIHPEIKLGSDSHPGGEPHFDPRSRTLIDMAKQARFHREIYCFEFSFKPLRHIYIGCAPRRRPKAT